MVEVGTGGSGTRFIKKSYPVEEGLIAGTTKCYPKESLKPEEKSLIKKIDKVGL
jgi:hypothetical protein